MPGPKRGSGPRSGLYSEAKFTNWTPFDPFGAEADRVNENRPPDAIVTPRKDVSVPVYMSSLQDGFVRPFTVEDVRTVLCDVPAEHLEGLAGVFLLGGTAKQRRSRRFKYGLYGDSRIYLHPLAERFIEQRWNTPPKPSVVREYTRFGASFVQESGDWILRFSLDSLRLFYLYDVLLHEIGHHVERYVRPRPSAASERYATWFAQYQSLAILRREETETIPPHQ